MLRTKVTLALEELTDSELSFVNFGLKTANFSSAWCGLLLKTVANIKTFKSEMSFSILIT